MSAPISLQNATRFALWLAQSHPTAFRALVARLNAPRMSSATAGLGRFGYAGREVYVSAGRQQTPRYARTGAFGDDLIGFSEPSFSDIAVSDIEPLDLSSAFDPADLVDWANSFSEPTLQPIGTSAVPSGSITQVASSNDSSGGFWGSLGDAFSSAGTVIGAVARNLTNPTTLAAAGGLASSIIQSNAATQVANAQQQAVLATQLARVQGGVSPAPIQYATTATGQKVPMYYNPSTGQYQAATPQVLSSLIPSGLPSWLPWVVGGGIVISLFFASSRS